MRDEEIYIRDDVREGMIAGNIPIFHCCKCEEPLFINEEALELEGEMYCYDCAYDLIHERKHYLDTKDIVEIF